MLTVTRPDGATTTEVLGGRLLHFADGVARVAGALLPRVEAAANAAGYRIGLELVAEDQADELVADGAGTALPPAPVELGIVDGVRWTTDDVQPPAFPLPPVPPAPVAP